MKEQPVAYCTNEMQSPPTLAEWSRYPPFGHTSSEGVVSRFFIERPA